MPKMVCALSPEGRPLHPMLPPNGKVPEIKLNLLEDGQVSLAIFCRSGPVSGKYFTRHMPLEQALNTLQIIHKVWENFGPESLTKELEATFGWEWTGTSPTLAGSTSPATNLTLADLGL